MRLLKRAKIISIRHINKTSFAKVKKEFETSKKSPDESSQCFYSLMCPFCFSSEVSFLPFSID